MTIGDRIKFFRERQNLTQKKLAEISGLHPVSIRKYETNKMIPQAPQIEKIANALKVNTIALTGVNIDKMRFDTVGNVMGVLMSLLSAGVLEVSWDNLPNGKVNVKTVKFERNSGLTCIFESELAPSMINNLIDWYKTQNKYYELLLQKEQNDSELKRCKALKDIKDKELQSDRCLLL